MADIERKLAGFSVERLLGLRKEDPDRLQVEKMAQAVSQWDIVPRASQEHVAAAPRIEVVSPFDQALAEYRTRPHTAELITNFQRVLWEQISEISGVDVMVPVVAESQKTIEEMEKKTKEIIFVPEAYAGQAQRSLIAAAFKLVGNTFVPNNWSMRGNNSVSNESRAGYRWVDMAIDAPHRNTTEQQARNLTKKGAAEEGADGMNLSEYAIAGLQSKLITGKYLDEGWTWSRLLGSRDEGGVVYAYFGPDGHLGVDSGLAPRLQHDALGARFSSGVSCFRIILVIFSILRAFCRFLGEIARVGYIF